MTYIAKRRRQMSRRTAARHQPLSGLFDLISGTGNPAAEIREIVQPSFTSDSTECLPNADAATAAIDARWQDIAQNWNPTGNFAPSDMDAAITATIKALSDAQVTVMFAPKTTSDAGEMIAQSIDDIGKKLRQAAPYATAVQDAKNTGATVINSPGFKTWITTSLVVVSAAYATRAVLDCQLSWLNTAANVIDSVRAVVMRIVDIVVKAADTVLEVVDDTLDAYKYIKYGAIAVGAIWLLTKLKSSSSSA